jgi:uncharacterized protein
MAWGGYFVAPGGSAAMVSKKSQMNVARTFVAATKTTRRLAHRQQQQEESVVAREVVQEAGRDETMMLADHQAKAANVLADFALSERFNPLLPNPHVQSIGGFLARKQGRGAYVSGSSSASSSLSKAKDIASLLFELVATSTPTPSASYSSEVFSWESRERIETPDGDWFYADSVQCRNQDADAATTPTLLLIHGLESNAESPLTKEMACAVVDFMHVSCLNFRGCAADSPPNDTMGGYHLGFTDDLHQYLSILQQRGNSGGIFLAGFSLGANVVLKCLGELGAAAVTRYGIRGALALAAPLDQERNAVMLARPGVNRVVYTNMLLQSLKRKAQFQLDRFCNGDANTTAFDYPRAMAATTITDFDDAFIAPLYGFTDCWDYYRQTSSLYYLPTIAVPTLIINARDDPFFDPAVWPASSDDGRDNDEATIGRHVRMERMEHGGHLGFYFHQRPDHSQPVPGTSWAPNEMRLFFQHVLRRTASA